MLHSVSADPVPTKDKVSPKEFALDGPAAHALPAANQQCRRQRSDGVRSDVDHSSYGVNVVDASPRGGVNFGLCALQRTAACRAVIHERGMQWDMVMLGSPHASGMKDTRVIVLAILFCGMRA